jgi:hypothetical protein
MKYSFWKGVKKGLISMIIFAIPVLINMFPDFMNLTIGGVLVVVVNYIKFNIK